ncbi:helix-turn-helix domain-containing protein [Paenibacillus oceani]|uniref:Helix-turn-helix transcriptional regulator n=1 Tax=Paenibacillus oceani TaxID=2772510 RepID=A0A927CGH1_9BACL|nr:AraC family transcriptional regulator [Paenibacillus oceani]MBD2865511.1 helix-turn-helix transcriptional regulator [Paenibacillus oceani]
MNAVKRTFTEHRNSLFVKLLSGFLLVIALLLSFNVLSFTFFQTNIQKQIIDHNTLNMKNTVNGYEKQMQLVESAMLRFYFNDRFSSSLNGGEQPNYYAAAEIKTEMNALLANPMLHLENMFLLFRDHPFVIEKESTTNTVNMFTKFYVSESYGPVFWQRQFSEIYTFRVFPAAGFTQYNYNKSESFKGELLPVVMKNKFNSQYIVAALLDARSLFRSLHYNGEDSFFILDGRGDLLFRSFTEGAAAEDGSVRSPSLPDGLAFPNNEGYVNEDDYYYFYKKGSYSGLTYVNVIPNVRIASQVQRLNLVLLAIMTAAVVLSVLISILLSMKFNNPIQGMIRLLQTTGQPHKLKSSIREFDWLGRSIADIVHANVLFRQDLTKKNKLLQNYGYMSKIKNIRSWTDLRDLIETNKPYYFLVFQLSFTERFDRLTGDDQEKTAYCLKEYMNIQLSERFADSVTLQMEKDQVISLLFAGEEPSAVMDTLLLLKQVLDRDKEYCIVTIAFRPALYSTDELTAAYEEAQAMIASRPLSRDTRIVTEAAGGEPVSLMTFAKEQDYSAHLLAGRDDKAAELLLQLLDHLDHSGAGARQYGEFGKEAVAATFKLLLEHQYDISGLFGGQSPFLHLRSCWSKEEYESFIRRLTSEAAALVRERKAERDPIRDFVLEYVAKHYGEDISLEQVADKLNLSRGYLSTYFHEKTGQTFSDYVNGLRMQRAKEMLSETDTLIQDIAGQVGYQNVNSFIRMFKRMCGLTPGEFRRIALQEGADGGRS